MDFIKLYSHSVYYHYTDYTNSTYSDMISAAIVTLKERNGSSYV